MITTNPSPYLINVPAFQNVQDNATGQDVVSELSNRVNQIGEMVDYDNKTIKANIFEAFDTGTITFNTPTLFTAGFAGTQISATGGTGGTGNVGPTGTGLDVTGFPEGSVVFATQGGPTGVSTFFVSTGTGEVVVDGKLTVTGLIDPTGLVLTPQPQHPSPGPYESTTLWWSTGSALYAGSMPVLTNQAAVSHAIALGSQASNTVPNSIVLNASGTGLAASAAGLYIAPVRYAEGDGILMYNSTTREVSWVSGMGPTGAEGATGPTGPTPTFSGIYRYSTTNVVNPGGYSTTIVQYDTSVNDSTTWYNNTTGRFTPTMAGWYQVSAGAYVYNETSEVALSLRKNGTIILQNGGFGGYAYGNVSMAVYFNGTTDYVDVVSITQTAVTNSQYQTTSPFTLVYMSP